MIGKTPGQPVNRPRGSKLASQLNELVSVQGQQERSRAAYVALLQELGEYLSIYGSVSQPQSSKSDSTIDQDLAIQVALAIVRDAASSSIDLGKEGLEALLKVSKSLQQQRIPAQRHSRSLRSIHRSRRPC